MVRVALGEGNYLSGQEIQNNGTAKVTAEVAIGCARPVISGTAPGKAGRIDHLIEAAVIHETLEFAGVGHAPVGVTG